MSHLSAFIHGASIAAAVVAVFAIVGGPMVFARDSFVDGSTRKALLIAALVIIVCAGLINATS